MANFFPKKLLELDQFLKVSVFFFVTFRSFFVNYVACYFNSLIYLFYAGTHLKHKRTEGYPFRNKLIRARSHFAFRHPRWPGCSKGLNISDVYIWIMWMNGVAHRLVTLLWVPSWHLPASSANRNKNRWTKILLPLQNLTCLLWCEPHSNLCADSFKTILEDHPGLHPQVLRWPQ